MRIVVPGELPGLNETIAGAKQHWAQYASAKAHWTGIVAALACGTTQMQRVHVRCHWYTKDRRRDPDNVAAGGTKIILDGLVLAGVLPGDGWAYVASISHTFAVDKRNPRVEVELDEAEEAAS